MVSNMIMGKVTKHVSAGADVRLKAVIQWLARNDYKRCLWLSMSHAVAGLDSKVDVICDNALDTVVVSKLQNGDVDLLIEACEALGFKWRYQIDEKTAMVDVKSYNEIFAEQRQQVLTAGSSKVVHASWKEKSIVDQT